MTPGHIHPITKSLEPLSDNGRLQMWRIRTAIYAGQDAPPFYQRSPESLEPAAPCPPSQGRGTFLSKAHRAARITRLFHWVSRGFFLHTRSNNDAS